MRAIGIRGNAAVLVDVGDGMGRVWDSETETVGPELPIASIAARGYWEGVGEKRSLARKGLAAVKAAPESPPWPQEPPK